MWRKKGHLKVAEKNRKWRKKILELAGDQSQNMVTMLRMLGLAAPTTPPHTPHFRNLEALLRTFVNLACIDTLCVMV